MKASALMVALLLASHAPKPIELLRMPRIVTSRDQLPLEIRVQPVASDRVEWAMLCEAEWPCTLEKHERLTMRDVEGESTPRLWRPLPWLHLEPGAYRVVVAIGPVGGVRASDSLSLEVVE